MGPDDHMNWSEICKVVAWRRAGKVREIIARRLRRSVKLLPAGGRGKSGKVRESQESQEICEVVSWRRSGRVGESEGQSGKS